MDLMLRAAKRGYQAENWKARTAEEVSGGKRAGEVVGTGMVQSFVCVGFWALRCWILGVGVRMNRVLSSVE